MHHKAWGAAVRTGRALAALGLLAALSGCPSFGTPKIPCHADEQCPTNYGCNASGICEQGVHGQSNQLKVTGLVPNTVAAGSADFTLAIDGSGFANDCRVTFGSDSLAPSSVSSTHLAVTIPAADVANPGGIPVAVVNPTSNAGTSNAMQFTVSGSPNPKPTVAAVAPSHVTSQTAVTLTVTGTGFVATTAVDLDGTALSVSSATATQLTVSATDAQVGAARQGTLHVINPAPGGGVDQISLEVDNPAPTLTAVSPNQIAQGSTALPVTLTGTGFRPDSVARIGSTDLVTTYGSDTSLTATIPADLLLSPGQLQVVVFAPAPGGGTSSAVPFTVLRPSAVIATLTPSSALIGSPDLTLEATGSGFDSTTALYLDNTPLVTTVVDGGVVDAVVTASLMATPAVHQVTAHIAGAAPSSPVSFTVGYPAPTLDALSPNAVDAGSGNTDVALAGSGFVPGVTSASFGGSSVPTDVFADGGAVAHLPAAQLASGAVVQVTVSNPAPLGGTSAPLDFTITWPPPHLDAVSPTGVQEGSPDQTVTLSGENLVAGPIASANGIPLATTSVSASSLTAVIPANMLVTATTLQLTVHTGGPGGGDSNTLPFSVLLAPATLLSVSPASAPVGAANVALTGYVKGCDPSCALAFDDAGLPSSYAALPDGGGQVSATLAGSFLTAGGTHDVRATRAGAADSNALPFDVLNPVPTLSSASPASLPVGSASSDVVLTGTGFIAGQTTAALDGTAVPADVTSPTTLTAHVPASLLASGRTAQFTATNPAPGGGTSAPLGFDVTWPAPVLSSLSPSSAVSGGASFTLTATGSSFVNGAHLTFDGTSLTTTVSSATQASATVPSSLIATAHTASVTLVNPGPGGGASNALAFAVSPPITTAVGSGFVGVAAASAAFGQVRSAAVKPGTTDVYFADPDHNLVGRIDAATGTIAAVAGTGACGFSGDNGPASAARLCRPRAIAFDSAGDLFIVDGDGTRLREVSAAGTISSLAGDGTCATSGDNGSASAAQLGDVSGIAVDASGNIYLASCGCGGNSVRKLSGGTITAFATGLSCPRALAIDAAAGNLYIAEESPPTSHVKKVPLTGGAPAAITATFNKAEGLTVDAPRGNLIVADQAAGKLFTVALTTGGFATTWNGVNAAGNGTLAPLSASGTVASSAAIGAPTGSFIDAAGNVAFISDRVAGSGGTVFGHVYKQASSYRVQFDDGLYVLGAPLATRLLNPGGVAVDGSGALYLSDTGHDQILKLSGGSLTVAAGSGIRGDTDGTATSARLTAPQGLWIDSGGTLYFVESSGAVRKLSGGQVTTLASGLLDPRFVAGDNAGLLYVSEVGGNRVTQLNTSGTVLGVVAGSASGTCGFSGDGAAGTSALLCAPAGLALDGSGNLLIADSANHRIRSLQLAGGVAGNISTVAGDGTASSTGDNGPASLATFDAPWGLTAGSAGIYVTDVADGLVRLIDPGNVVRPIAGSGSSGFSGDSGAATGAQLDAPAQVAVGPGSLLYIADTQNDRIRQVGP